MHGSYSCAVFGSQHHSLTRNTFFLYLIIYVFFNYYIYLIKCWSCKLKAHSCRMREETEDWCFHLALHQHGHVHEHAVKFSDAVLQLDDLIVPRLNLIHGLLGDVVHYYLKRLDTRKEKELIKTVFIF